MESSEFDHIVKQKLSEESNLYHAEIEDAKTFIWSEIKTNEKKKAIVIPWYYTAAAAILFIICTSLLFVKIQDQHQQQIGLLNKQLQQISSRGPSEKLVALKNEQLDMVCKVMDSLEQSNLLLKNKPKMLIPKATQIVYKTDTVFLTKIEYITEYIPVPQKSDSVEQSLQMASKLEPETATDLIYPDVQASPKEKPNENASVKLKLNTLTIH